MIRLAIIADDLTGALDAAAPFAGRGLRTRVALSPDAVPEALDAEIIAVSTRSREIAPEAARAAVAQVLAALPPCRIFKKIDSRMKGNIAAELSAIPAGPVLAAPAIPDFGRVVRDGHVTGFGVDTPIAIAPLLDRPATIPDTETESDMAALDLEGETLLVGARGLAEALAARMTGRAASPPALAGPRGLYVIGSRDPITTAQIAATGIAPTFAPNGIIPENAGALVQATQGATAEAPAAVARNLARGIMALPRPDTLFLTGGATAEAVLSGIGIRTLNLLGECLPGLPVAQADGMTIVAKSGGFGQTDTLAQLVRMIEGA